MKPVELQASLWNHAPKDWAYIQEPTARPLWQSMLDEVRVGPETRLLDAGCGGGGASIEASKRGAQVSGIDVAEGLIAIARERLPAGDFRVGDIEALPYDDDTFDGVIVANAIQYAADPVAALREVTRVCRPAGRIVAALFGPPEKVEFRTIFAAVRDAMPNPPAGGGPFALSMPGTLESLFEQAGLAVTNVGEVDCPFRYPDFETFWRGNSAAGPLQGVIRNVGEEKIKSVMADAVARYRLDGQRISIEPNIFRYVVAVT